MKSRRVYRQLAGRSTERSPTRRAIRCRQKLVAGTTQSPAWQGKEFVKAARRWDIVRENPLLMLHPDAQSIILANMRREGWDC